MRQFQQWLPVFQLINILCLSSIQPWNIPCESVSADAPSCIPRNSSAFHTSQPGSVCALFLRSPVENEGFWHSWVYLFIVGVSLLLVNWSDRPVSQKAVKCGSGWNVAPKGRRGELSIWLFAVLLDALRGTKPSHFHIVTLKVIRLDNCVSKWRTVG